MISLADFRKITPYLWELPKSYQKGMRVPARIYITKDMLEDILDERSVEQLINVATLPGIERYALAMPDIHQGYGFPIGGVAAMRTKDGVISPGGVGYDINCGVRLLRSNLSIADVTEDQIVALANQMQRDVPSGVGRGGRLKLNDKELNDVLNTGVVWALKKGFAREDDLEMMEKKGWHRDGDASFVSQKAKSRGSDQIGTLGAGNHFVELQEVVELFDEKIVETFGLFKGQLTIMIHTGSRGLGHQSCTDYVRLMNSVLGKYHIELPDRELSCAPFASDEGQQYYHAMAACANFAWTNRQLIAHHVRGSWLQVLRDPKKAELTFVYDVAHNMAKKETHDGVEYIVHRKGATRAFGPGSVGIPEKYAQTGQPVLIPGSMGTYSYVLAGTAQTMKETFGSTCHGAGRRMSRERAKRTLQYEQLKKELDDRGVVIRAGSKREVVEEAPEAYKDIEAVVDAVVGGGIAVRVAKMRPVAVVKG